MKTFGAVVVLLCALALPPSAAAQQDKLGKVTFPTSCDPRAQAQFERGVAMLHSYWFTEARKVFDAVLQQDPTCTMAYWGLAVN
jgi:Tfp pilus assembly protein PilF